MFEKLSSAIKKVTNKIASAIFVDKKLIDEILKDLQRALIEADVNVKLVKQISDELREKAIDEKIKGIEKKEQIIKLLHDRLLEILGGKQQELKIAKGKKQKIMLLGLYGAGKTTTTAKLANFYGKRGLKCCILGLDVHRPAAREQLEQLGKQHSIKVFINKEEKSPEKIYKEFKQELEDYDLAIIDTAGRHSLDKDLINEIKSLGKLAKPDYIILVMPADIGQAAKKQAEEFQSALKINGVIITRMDSTAKAGGALTACNETKAPVFFITTGEHIQDIETFNPESFLSRLLGMGDLAALLEKVQLASPEHQEKIQARLKEGKFNMLDLYEQLKSMEGVGSFSKIMDLIPGFGKIKEKVGDSNIDSQQANLKKWKAAIDSMTPEERESPELIEKQTARLGRIAKGSGNTTSSIRELISQYNLIKSFVKSGKSLEDMDINKLQKGGLGLSQKKLRKMAKKFRMI
jgi:signal recognition particle subunit SRP54